MTHKTLRRIAKSESAVTIMMASATVLLGVVGGTSKADPVSAVVGTAAVVSYAIVGGLIASRNPQNPNGWLQLAIGLGLALTIFTDEYSVRALVTEPGSLPLGTLAGWANNWLPFATVVPAIQLFFLTFPTGRLPSARWRPVAVGVVALSASLTLFAILRPSTGNVPQLATNPTGVPALAPALDEAAWVLGVGAFAVGLASIASVVVRFRRSSGEERQQLRWLAFASALSGLLLIGTVTAGLLGADAIGDPLGNLFLFSLAVGLPTAAGIALLKYRLYEIDVVISKTLVYGSLATLITLIYVAIVVGIGSLFGRGDRPNIVLSVAATALVAIAFQPFRRRAERVANRLVYGQRANPYEVLSRFADRMAGAYAADEIMPRMARVLADGTGAAATVWLKVNDELRPVASWPPDAVLDEPVVVGDIDPVSLLGSSRTAFVRDQGELLGALTVTKALGAPLTGEEVRLIDDLASQAGLMLRNVRLIEELKGSRQRLVTAQDEERSRLERDLHDGAQQRLVTLSLALRIARDRAARSSEPGLVREISEAEAELARSLQELRELARGIHPIVLRQGGLAAALGSLVDRSAFPVDLRHVVEGRFSRAVEASVYFVVSEALANVAKHARASTASIAVTRGESGLVVEVVDDGVGGASLDGGSGLRGLADRVGAVGGALRVESPPGQGTRVIAEIPCG